MFLDIAIKSIIGGLIIGIVSTLAQKQPTLGAFIMGIPLVSFITLIIMHYSGVEFEILKTFSYQTVYFVLVSLLFFPIFVAMYQLGFWTALLISAIITGSAMLSLVKFIT